MAKLRAHLRQDVKDEQAAVRGYTARIREAQSPALKKTLRHIKGEEQQHQAMLKRHLGANLGAYLHPKKSR